MRIAVTGAGGRLGSRVVDLLAADAERHVVAIRRRDMQRQPQLPNVSNKVADYADLAALRHALRHVETLVFVSSDGPAAPVLVHHQNVIRAAADSGVAHIIALSGLDADLESPFCYAVTYGYTERILRDSGRLVTIARASIYTEFFLRWIIQAAATGQLRLPAGDGRISLISREDVGRCLAALATAPATGRRYDLTGPESVDLTTIAAAASDEWRTRIRYVNTSPVEYHIEMATSGEASWWMYAFSTMFESVREQRWAAVSDEVFRITGRRPTSLREVLARHRDTR